MANTQFIQQQGYQIVEDEETPLKLRLSEFKELLKASLEELDIRISLDISDGEVTAEVEVLLDGEVVASDSDFIQL